MFIFAAWSVGFFLKKKFIWRWSFRQTGQRRAHHVRIWPNRVTYISPPSLSPFLLTFISKANSPSTIVRLHLNMVFTWHLHIDHVRQLSHSRTGARLARMGSISMSWAIPDPEVAGQCLKKLLMLTLMHEFRGLGERRASTAVFQKNLCLIQAEQTMLISLLQLTLTNISSPALPFLPLHNGINNIHCTGELRVWCLQSP
jgi:hypothetical protein